MKYHRVPRKWRDELHRYTLEYLKSGCKLSVREYCRTYGIPQGTFKNYATKPLCDWIICSLMELRSLDEETEQRLARLSRIEDEDCIYLR